MCCILASIIARAFALVTCVYCIHTYIHTYIHYVCIIYVCVNARVRCVCELYYMCDARVPGGSQHHTCVLKPVVWWATPQLLLLLAKRMPEQRSLRQRLQVWLGLMGGVPSAGEGHPVLRLWEPQVWFAAKPALLLPSCWLCLPPASFSTTPYPSIWLCPCCCLESKSMGVYYL